MINQQERRLGGTLFDRSNRSQVRARLAARGVTHVLQVGMLPSQP